MKAKAVIFDMDGVIFDSERLVLECWEQVGTRHHLANIREVFIECIGTNKEKTKEIVYEHYGKDFAYDKFARASSRLFHEKVKAEGLPVKKGARELLEYFRHQRMPVGLASSTRLAVVEAEMLQAGLYDYFEVMVGGDQLKNSKPSPDIYLMACEAMGVAPKDAYAIEDSYNGIRAAYAAGMMPVMVPDILPATEEMKKMSVVVLEDLLQVRDYFREEDKADGNT
ncbi:MAG: HAD family phosphatase [Clostridium sp.]|nr:HAD family phosphatase [Clostridium sp.]